MTIYIWTTHAGAETSANSLYALIGPKCGEAANIIATIASQRIKIVQVSYGVVDPVYSDVDFYSHFYRTVPDYTKYVEPIVSILEHFDWKIIGTVTQNHFTPTVEALADTLSTKSNEYRILRTITIDHLQLEGDSLPESVHIFIAMVEEKNAADTLCAAFKSGLTGQEFVWILLGDYVEGWWRSLHVMECTEVEMLSAIESTIILTNSVISHKPFTSIKQQNQSEFWEDFRTNLKTNTDLDFKETRALRVLQAYDAVWSVANALNTTLAEHNIKERANSSSKSQNQLQSTKQVETLLNSLNRNMKRLSFEGTSGEIKFTNESNSPQSPVTSIFQMQNGTIVPVGIHTEEQNGSVLDFTFFGNNLSWQGEGPPRDRPILVFQVVELWIIVIMLILTALGIAYAIVILIVNCVYRKHKVIKASSPYINILIIVGCILGLLTIPVLSIENLDVDHVQPDIVYSIFCNIRPWMVNFSMTLAFGALFVKTWRVYVVFKNPWLRARPYKDYNLVCMVGVLLLTDVVSLSISTWRNPLKLLTFTVPSSNDHFTVDAYRICQTGDIYVFNLETLLWFCLSIGRKVVLFVFGTFLVIKTSKIKQKNFQDSRFVGSAIYATVIACGLGVPLSILLMYLLQEDIGFVIASTTILFCSYFILSSVFLPRFNLLRKYQKKVPTAVLLGLNPIFPIRKPSHIQLDGLENKDSDNQHIRSANSTKTPTSPVNNSNVDGSGSDDTEWESAYEENTKI